jgi:hypothetical protein
MAIQVHLMHLHVVQKKHDFALKLKFELLANSLQVESRKCQNIANIGIQQYSLFSVPGENHQPVASH